MDTLLLLKGVAAFVLVMALMATLPWVFKKFGLAQTAGAGGKKKRLQVVEYLSIDPRRRLVLVRRDDREHLLVIGPEGQTVVETGIAASTSADTNTVLEWPTLKGEKHVQS